MREWNSFLAFALICGGASFLCAHDSTPIEIDDEEVRSIAEPELADPPAADENETAEALYKEAERLAKDRQFFAAIEKLKRLRLKHGSSPYAEPAQTSIKTLHESLMRDLRHDVREVRFFVKEQRWSEAKAALRRIEEQYPEHPQLPKLRELVLKP